MTDFGLKLALNAQETLDSTIICLSKHISLKTEGALNVESLFKILVRAASQRETIEQTAKELKNVPTSNTIRSHLSEINNFDDLEAELNTVLKSQISKGLKKKRQSIAIDINLISYYSNPR